MWNKIKLFIAGLVAGLLAIAVYLFTRKKDKTEELLDDAKDLLDRDIQSDIDFIDKHKELKRKE